MVKQISHSDLAAIVQPLAESLRADHADLEVIGYESETAHLRLVLTDEACLECIMPKDFLETMLLDVIGTAYPQVHRVALNDPRETANGS